MGSFVVGDRACSTAVNSCGRCGVVTGTYEGAGSYAVRVQFDSDLFAHDHAVEFLRHENGEPVADDAGNVFEGGDWAAVAGEIAAQEEGRAAVADQIAKVERDLAELDTAIACENGSLRTSAIIARHCLAERLAALRESAAPYPADLFAAIERRDLDAITAFVAASNAARQAGTVAA